LILQPQLTTILLNPTLSLTSNQFVIQHVNNHLRVRTCHQQRDLPHWIGPILWQGVGSSQLLNPIQHSPTNSLRETVFSSSAKAPPKSRSPQHLAYLVGNPMLHHIGDHPLQDPPITDTRRLIHNVRNRPALAKCRSNLSIHKTHSVSSYVSCCLLVFFQRPRYSVSSCK
jgi:hypothetical protein